MSIVLTYVMAFFAMACYALMPVVLKKLQLDVPPLRLISITMAGLCALALAASLILEKDYSFAKVTPKMWTGMMMFSVLNLIGFGVMLLVIAKIPIVEYQLVGLATPVVGALFAYWMLGEEFKLQYLVGLFFIGIGLFVALRRTGS